MRKKIKHLLYNLFSDESYSVLRVIVVIIVIIGAILGMRSWVGHLVKSQMNNPTYIGELSRKVRPSMIFNSNESVVLDMGAGEFIDEIIVDIDTSMQHIRQITIIPNVYYNYPPLITPIEAEFEFKITRGKRYAWVYKMNIFDDYKSQEGGKRVYEFMLELLD